MGNEVTIGSLGALESTLKPLAPQFAEVLGAVMSSERFIRSVIVSVDRTPKLLNCTRQSLFNAAMSCAVLGLEPDGVTGQSYILPFKERAQAIIGYKGYNTLAARSGITVQGEAVREGDEFDFELGDRGFVRHKPKLGNKGRIVAAWATGAALGRPSMVSVLGIDDIMAIMAKAPGAKMSDSPWNEPTIGFPAMGAKSAKRRLGRAMPLNVMQLAAALETAHEERGHHAWITADRNVVIEGDVIAPRSSDTPTAAQLLDRAKPAASRPEVPSMDWGTYCERWQSIAEEAKSASQIVQAWNSAEHRAIRDKINPPQEHIDELLSFLNRKRAALRESAEAATRTDVMT